MRHNFLFSLKQDLPLRPDRVTCLLADSSPQALAAYGRGSTQRGELASSCITVLFPISEQITDNKALVRAWGTRRSCLWQVMC